MSLNSSGQYTLLYEFDWEGVVDHFNTEAQTMYYFVVNPEESIYFYNEDFTFYKVVAAPEIPGFDIYMNSSFEHLSSNIFNTDPLIEFSCKYISTATGMSRHVIYNEDLDIIVYYDSANIRPFYQTLNGEIRLDVQKYAFPNTIVSTQTYLLQEAPTSVGSLDSDQGKPAFPNPAGEEIYIPYDLEPGETAVMKIFNLGGQHIRTLNIGGHFKHIKVNTSGLSQGTYIYRYKNNSGKFVIN
jgi:hypothetical protein